MTPAPISVERFDLYGVSYVRATDHDASIAALLHQLAELEAAVTNLREAFGLKDAAFKLMRDAALEHKARAAAAERAREEATGLLLEWADDAEANGYAASEYPLVARTRAFLAASGGK